MIDLERAHLVPRLPLASMFVHQGQGRDVVDVMVDGRWLMGDTVAEAQRVADRACATAVVLVSCSLTATR